MNNVPNVIIAGVNKAGTTSLFMYLAQHPEICQSAIKEVSHFAPVRYGLPAPPVEEYHKHFKAWAGQPYRLEATGGYFYGGKTLAEAIRGQLGDVKLIFVFREPIARCISFYRFKKSQLLLDEALSFDQYLSDCLALSVEEMAIRDNNRYWGIAGGMYARYFDDWVDVFGSENIHVVFFDALKADAKGVLGDICHWLDIEHDAYLENVSITIENKSMAYKNAFLQKVARGVNDRFETFWRANPTLKQSLRERYYQLNGKKPEESISPEALERLTQLFAPYNARLAERLTALGYDELPDWLTERPQVVKQKEGV